MSATLSPLIVPATPVVVDHALGSYVYDVDGTQYLDFTTGIGVTSTGHCHPAVVEAAREQVGKLIHGQFTTVRHQPMAQLTEMLGDRLPTGLDSVFYANSGSEAVEASIRLARMATGRSNIIAFQGGFHGRTYAAASLTTANPKLRSGIGALLPGVFIAPFPYALRYGWDEETAVDFALKELDFLLASTTSVTDTAAFIIEPVLGDGGYLPTPTRFLQGLRERADQHGMALIIDEVQTGVGRTGTFWGHEPSGVTPDILITAKGIASGFPISAIAASTEMMSKAWPGSQGGTYGGNAVACAAAVATLKVVESEGLVANSATQGERLISGLREVAQTVTTVGDVRGRGLMVACEFLDPDGTPRADLAAAAQQAAISENLLLLTCGARGNIVRFIPPLIVTADQVDDGVAAWAKALAKIGA